MYPETDTLMSTLPSGSGDPAQNSTGHGNSGFALGEFNVERINIAPAIVADEHLRSIGSGIGPRTQGTVELNQPLQAEEVLRLILAF